MNDDSIANGVKPIARLGDDDSDSIPTCVKDIVTVRHLSEFDAAQLVGAMVVEFRCAGSVWVYIYIYIACRQ